MVVAFLRSLDSTERGQRDCRTGTRRTEGPKALATATALIASAATIAHADDPD